MKNFCVVAFLSLSLPTFAAVQIGPGNVAGEAGNTRDIPIRLTGGGNVTGAQFDVVFDPDRISLGKAKSNDPASNHNVESHQIAPGRQRIVIYSNTLTALREGDIAHVPVTWGVAGTSGLTLEAVKLTAPDGSNVLFSLASVIPGGKPAATSADAVGWFGRHLWLLGALGVGCLILIGWWRMRSARSARK